MGYEWWFTALEFWLDLYQKTLSESGFFRRLLGQTEDSEETVEEETEESPKKNTKAKKVSE